MICSSRIWETYNWDDVTRGLLTGGPGTPLVRHIHNKAKVYVQSTYSFFACLFMFDHTVCLNVFTPSLRELGNWNDPSPVHQIHTNREVK